MAGAARVKRYFAPGRVNLIGEHTDYNDGFVMPVAIHLGCEVETAAARKRELRIKSDAYGEEVALALDDIPNAEKRGHWSDYTVGVARELAFAGHKLKPLKMTIHNTLPPGSGLSSSAALEVSSALALLDGSEMDPLAIAELCQRAEREFVGLPVGIMDQYASVFGEEHAALLIDCRSRSHQTVRLPDGVSIVAVNTLVKHELSGSAYRDRVAECAEALSYFPGKLALRDVTLGELERTAAKIPEIPLARARHIVLENFRVQQFHAASERGDLHEMGKLFNESHRSLKEDYEVSCEELDFLQAAALKVAGVFGARMTGGGFGGCTVNLVAAGAEERFEREIRAAYQDKFSIDPAVYRCVPSAGAHRVS